VKKALGIFKGAKVQEVESTTGTTLDKVNKVHLHPQAEYSCKSYNIWSFLFSFKRNFTAWLAIY
jgi:hypothetical protein